MICKRCHKRIIDKLTMNFDLQNGCICNLRRYFSHPREGEIVGIERGSKVRMKVNHVKR